jgi:tRNA(Ile)-lysidine synthase
MPQTLIDAVDAWLTAHVAEYPKARLCVAVSGGADSATLLALLAAVRDARPAGGRPRLRAVHVHHHLQAGASEWARRARALARRLRVPCKVLHARVPRGKRRSLEADARDARYALLREELADGEVLLTAHHADDQLETVLLQLLRGAGVKGLAAMPSRQAFGRGWLARPLLAFDRDAILGYARAVGIEWSEDPMNLDERFDRSFLRLRVTPLLRARWPGGAEAVSRSARHAAEAQRLLDALGRLDVERASDGATLTVRALRVLEPARRRNALRYWIAEAGATLPDARRLHEIAGPLLAARADARPVVTWSTHAVRRDGDRLWLEAASAARRPSSQPEVPAQSWAWKQNASLTLLGGGGTLRLVQDPHGPIDLERLPEEVRVERRKGGEELQPRAEGPARSLKSLLQAAKIGAGERERMPLLKADGRLLAAGDRWIDVSIRALTDARRRARLVWRRGANARSN